MRRPATAGAGRGRPLRRRPKQLSEEPALYERGGAGGGLVLSDGTAGAGVGRGRAAGGRPRRRHRRAGRGVDAAGGSATARTAVAARRGAADRPPARLCAGRGATHARGAARRAASACGSTARPTTSTWTRRSRCSPRTRCPRTRTSIVRERVARARSVVLAVDVSGSMSGERVADRGRHRRRAGRRAARATSSRCSRSGPTPRCSCGSASASRRLALLDLLLRVPARGLTNVAFPLGRSRRGRSRAAGARRAGAAALRRVHNAGPDPRFAAPAAAARRAARRLGRARRRAGARPRARSAGAAAACAITPTSRPRSRGCSAAEPVPPRTRRNRS